MKVEGMLHGTTACKENWLRQLESKVFPPLIVCSAVMFLSFTTIVSMFVTLRFSV